MGKFVFFALALCSGATAPAAIITSLSVEQTADPSGQFRYAYTLSVDQSSDVSAGVFALDIPVAANLSSLSGPNGWDIAYGPGDTVVTWISPTPTSDLLPNTSALFSFLSPLNAGPRDYLVAGFGESDIFTTAGQIAGPDISAVPEPSTMIIFGALSLLSVCYWWRLKATNVGHRPVVG